MSSEKDFTSGSIIPNIVRFALPVLAALLLQAAYGAADLLIVGKFGDATGVSAVGLGSEVMLTVTVILAGLTMGATVLIGQRIGSRNYAGAGRAVGAACALFIIVALVLTVVMELLTEPLCRLMQAPEESFDKTVEYVRICSGGIIFITAYNVISGIFRGLGNSKLPMIFVAISAAANVIGDLILCGPCGLDAAGAAIATISAQAISVVLSIIIIFRQDLPFELNKSYITLKCDEWKTILKIGAPLALQDLLVHISFLAINSFANAYGLIASAGYAAGGKITSFLMLIPSAVGQSVTAFVSQNVGAGHFTRARQALFKTMMLGLGVGAVVCVLGYVFAPEMSMLFTDDAAVVEQSTLLLRGFAPDCFLTNVLFAFMGFYNGHGWTTPVMIQGITSALGIRLVFGWFVSTQSWGNLFFMGLSTPISTIYGIIFFAIYFLIRKKKSPVFLGYEPVKVAQESPADLID